MYGRCDIINMQLLFRSKKHLYLSTEKQAFSNSPIDKKISVLNETISVMSKEFLDIQANIECRFTLKRVHDMIRTYSQMYRTDKYSQLN